MQWVLKGAIRFGWQIMYRSARRLPEIVPTSAAPAAVESSKAGKRNSRIVKSITTAVCKPVSEAIAKPETVWPGAEH